MAGTKDVTRRRVGELLRGLFEILLQHPDGMQARQALDELAGKITLTEHERGSYEDGGRRFEKIVRFGTVDCVKAGWFLKNKGWWSVTEEGRRALLKYTDPSEFYGVASQLYRAWRAAQPDATAEDDGGEANTSARTISVTFESAEEQAWKEIEQYLRQMHPYEFQELVASLLRAMGYHVSWVAPPGKDGGVDIIAVVDPLGTRPPRIKVQVKRQNQSVNVEGVRSFIAVLGDGDVGLFVSLGGFTKDAEGEARRQESRRVTLIGLDRLFDLWVEHYAKLTDDARRRLPLRPIHFLAPEP
jgi:restriction system protein